MLKDMPPYRQYIPYRLFDGIHIPPAILQWKALPDIAKLAFGVIVRQIGPEISAVLYLEDIAGDLGVSVDTVLRAIRSLESAGLLSHKRTGRGSLYFCLWHEQLGDSLRLGINISQFRPGDCYRSWETFLFALVPISLVNRPGLSSGSKLLFGLLSFYGRSGKCFPCDQTLGAAMARSMSQLRRLRRELINVGLITYDPSSSDERYRFWLHPILIPSLRPPAQHSESAGDFAGRLPDFAAVSAVPCDAYKEEEIGIDIQKETNENVRPSNLGFR